MAKSRSIGAIYAELTLRDGKFKAGLKASRAALNEFSIAASKFGAGALAAGVTTAGAALTAGTLKTLDHVDALGDLSAQTGVAIADMMRLQQAYADGGRSAEDVGKDIGKMQRAIVMANEGGADPFASMGLSAAELFRQNPAGQFRMIGDALLKIQNPAERTAKSMAIFGKGGMGLATVFPGLDAATKSVGSMAELAQRFSGAMGEANDLIGHLPLKSDQFFVGFTAGVIGTILPELQKIDDHDFTKLGENLGDNLAAGFSMIGEGDWFKVAELKMSKAFLDIFGKVVAVGTHSFDLIGAAAEARSRTLLTSVFSGSDAGNSAFEKIWAEKVSAMEDWTNPFQSMMDNMDVLAKNEWRMAKNRAGLKKDSAAALTDTTPATPPALPAVLNTGMGAAFMSAYENFKLPDSILGGMHAQIPSTGAAVIPSYATTDPRAYQGRWLNSGRSDISAGEAKEIELLTQIAKNTKQTGDGVLRF